jgi:hypothetical protein
MHSPILPVGRRVELQRYFSSVSKSAVPSFRSVSSMCVPSTRDIDPSLVIEGGDECDPNTARQEVPPADKHHRRMTSARDDAPRSTAVTLRAELFDTSVSYSAEDERDAIR